MKIQMMNSQVLVGGHKIEDTPQFRSALEERQTTLLKEFDQKLQEFDKEKQQIEEDKVQVEHYKKFLQKLRDIMIALTTRLNERNETIDQLHEEIESYEKIIRELEDGIDVKIYRINTLEDLLKKNNIDIPDNTMPYVKLNNLI
jgi:chromosome segregation ATPase